MVRIGAVLLLLTLVLGSCDQSANRVSTLWTNVPEVASAVENFNASQREWQLLVEYREDPASLLVGPGVKADLVIARGLSSATVKDGMVSLDFLFDGGNLAKASFYQRGLEAGQQSDRIKLLPVSFDFPILVYSRKRLPDLPGFSLTVDGLKSLNEAFNAQPTAKNQRRLAFSPRWEGFGPTFLQWSGAGFQDGFQGNLGWNTEGLSAGLAAVRTWPSPGEAQAADFQQKYLQADPTPLLVSGRIQFYPSTLASFFNRPWKERRELDFRFLDQGGKALAADPIWAGIPSSSLTRGAGERFLAWFFQTGTQNLLIRQARMNEDRNFGLAQGVSSLPSVNGAALAEVFPELVGRLPAADQVSFWPALPLDWSTLHATVIKPWFDAAQADEVTLKAALEKQRSQAARH